MRAADDPTRDYVRLVADGYDACADDYNAARAREAADALAPLDERLPAAARVLDLGCGAGVPIARELSARFDVVGVDISYRQLALARTQAPRASFVRADMRSCAFAPASFDAVVSFYAIFHVPRVTHDALLGRIATWLRPGGLFLGTVGLRDEDNYTESDFFGVEMFWSNFAVDRYRTMLAGHGFGIIVDLLLPHGYGGDGHPAETHPLLLAEKVF